MHARPMLLTASCILLLCAGAVAEDAGAIGGRLLGTPRQVKDSIVYLASVPGEHVPPREPATMDQTGMMFVPKVLPIVKGSQVKFLNNDPTIHTVYSPDNEAYDLGEWGKGGTKTRAFESLGVYTQLCKKHPQMIAYIVVLQNPHFALTGIDGTFEIPNVPPGEYEITVWNERYRAEPQKVVVTAGKTASVEIALQR